MSYRKADHISYRKPGANRLEEGILVIPRRQTWDGKFSFRFGSDGTIVRDVPIKSDEWTAKQIWQLGMALGIHGPRYPWYSRSPELVSKIRLRIRFETDETVAPPPRESESERRTRTAREAEQEAQRQALRASIETNAAELADLREAMFVVKPSVVAVLRRREDDLVELQRLYNSMMRALNS